MRAPDWLLPATLVVVLGGCSAAPLRHPGRTTRPPCMAEQRRAASAPEKRPVSLDAGLWDAYCLEQMLHATRMSGPRLAPVPAPEGALHVLIPTPDSRESPPRELTDDLRGFELERVPRGFAHPAWVEPTDEIEDAAPADSPEELPLEVELDPPHSPSIEESRGELPDVEKAPPPPRNELPPVAPPRNVLPTSPGEAKHNGSLLEFAEDPAPG